MFTPTVASLAALALVACSRDAQRAEPEKPPPSAAPVVSVASVPASASAEPEPDAAALATDGAVQCKVAIRGVIEAAVYRGPGVDSPARQKTIEGLSPGQRDRWRGRDHGVRHLACTYAVEVNGVRYRHRHNGGQDITGDELDPKKCSLDATKREVEKHIAEFTDGCRDLHAGEYWGYRLDRLE